MTKQEKLFNFDEELKNNYEYICGADESGRGAIGGPITGAAVILKPSAVDIKINDSKQLSQKSREQLYDEIIENSISYSIDILNANYVDEHGIQQANRVVLQRAIESVLMKNTDKKILTIIDGNSLWNEKDLKWFPHGDGLSLSIAAASILAKVFRDRIMNNLSDEYPEFSFSQHKGYGTKIHKDLILKYGKIKNIHRRTFTKDLPDIYYG
jgi:ribonuclease HII